MPAGGLYDADLAAIHAAGFSDTFRNGFDWLSAQVDGPLFDVGCGDGTWLAHLADRVPVAGCDVSEEFVTRATARGLAVTQASAQNVSLPSDTACLTALGEVLSYGDPEALHPVRSAIDNLCPTPSLHWMGFDLIGPDVMDGCGKGRGEDWAYTSVTTVKDGILEREIITARAGRKTKTTHIQHLTTPEAVTAWLRRHGFDADIGDSYGPAPMLPGRFRVIARRS